MWFEHEAGTGVVGTQFVLFTTSGMLCRTRFSLSEIKIYRTSEINRISRIYQKYRTKFKKIQIVLKKFRRIWLGTIPKILNIAGSQLKTRIKDYKCGTVARLNLGCLCGSRKEGKNLADIKFYRTLWIERKFRKYRWISADKKTMVSYMYMCGYMRNWSCVWIQGLKFSCTGVD
jgi:hypothetical protein